MNNVSANSLMIKASKHAAQNVKIERYERDWIVKLLEILPQFFGTAWTVL